MKTLLITASTLAMIAAPASAQLLGGGGGLGGTLGGTVGSTMGSVTGSGSGSARGSGSILGGVDSTIRSTTRTATNGSASTDGSQSVDSRNGRVEANRSANAGLAGSTSQLLSSPLGPVGSSASGSGNASGNGSAGAQLIGTDAVTGLAGSAAGTAQSAASAAASRAGGLASSVPSAPTGLGGGASGEGSGSGNASGALGASPLFATAGSAAAAGSGVFAIEPGMPVMAPSGERIGKVREVVADSLGNVRQVLVGQGGRATLVDATNLSARGSGLVAGTGEGSVNNGPDESSMSPEGTE